MKTCLLYQAGKLRICLQWRFTRLRSGVTLAAGKLRLLFEGFTFRITVYSNSGEIAHLFDRELMIRDDIEI